MVSVRPFAAILVALTLAGCNNPRTVQPVPADEVAAAVSAELEEETGTAPDVTCPGELPAEVDAELVCSYTAGDPPADFTVTVTVSSVDDESGNVVFDMVAEPAPLLPPD